MSDTIDQLVAWQFIVEATLLHPNNEVSQINSFLQNIIDCGVVIFFPWNVIECCGKEFSYQTVFKV
jgi:hypothetical protein